MAQKQSVFCFKVFLKNFKPMIWRRIELKSDATFWHLASAIMDAMGWEGYHFFDFEIRQRGSQVIQYIGFPDDDFVESLPAWGTKLSDFFKEKNDKCDFVYDFGDNWWHTVKLEGIHPAEENTNYPVCLGGKRACPPEDCGGIQGYADLLEVLKNPEDEAYENMVEWLGEAFDPSEFDKDDVVFEDADERFEGYYGFPKPPEKPGETLTGKTVEEALIFTLEDGLNGLLKDKLVFIARCYKINNADQLKKDELVQRLKKKILKSFKEEIIYFSPEELFLFDPNLRKVLHKNDTDGITVKSQKDGHTLLKESLDIELLSQLKWLKDKPKKVFNLVDKCYLFFQIEDNREVISVPKEMRDFFQKTMAESMGYIMSCHKLQYYAIALASLYGVCTYRQFYKVIKKQDGTPFPLKKIEDYIIIFSERCKDIEADSDGFYTTLLDEYDYELIIASDMNRRYYTPTKEEVTAYHELIFGPQADEIFLRLRDSLLSNTCISDPHSNVKIDHSEAVKGKDTDILLTYEDILKKILVAARMGKGLYDLLHILDFLCCEFNHLVDMSKFYAIYLDLVENTRKWPLKGKYYSDLRKAGKKARELK